jgi:hypothetical protein
LVEDQRESVVPVVVVLDGAVPVEASRRAMGDLARAGIGVVNVRGQRAHRDGQNGSGNACARDGCALRRPEAEVLAEAMAGGFIARAESRALVIR